MCGEQATRDWWLICGGSFTEANMESSKSRESSRWADMVESLPDDDESLLCLITSYVCA